MLRNRIQNSGRAVLSPAAEIYWQRIVGEPGRFLVIEAESSRVRLTRKEVQILFRLFKRNPEFFSNPFLKDCHSKKSKLTQENEVSNNG